MLTSEQTTLLANVAWICGVLLLVTGYVFYIRSAHRKSQREKNRKNIEGGGNREYFYYRRIMDPVD